MYYYFTIYEQLHINYHCVILYCQINNQNIIITIRNHMCCNIIY